MTTKKHARKEGQLVTACKQYCLAAGAIQGNIANLPNVSRQLRTTPPTNTTEPKITDEKK